MAFDLGALLGGMSEQAMASRKEAQQRESDEYDRLTKIAFHIIDSPNTPKEMKDQAYAAFQQATMSHMFPDQFKPNKNKLHKFIEQYTGSGDTGAAAGYQAAAQSLMGGEAAQPGVGTGNGGRQGVVPPIQPQAVAQQPTPAQPMPMALSDLQGQPIPPTQPGVLPPPLLAPGQVPGYEPGDAASMMLRNMPPPPTPQPGQFPQFGQSPLGGMKFYTPQDFGFTPPKATARGFTNKQEVDDWNRANEFTAQANLKLVEAAANRAQIEAENNVELAFDLPGTGLKKGDKINRAFIPVLDALIKANNPKGDIQIVTKTNEKGEDVAHGINKATGKEEFTTNLGKAQMPGFSDIAALIRLTTRLGQPEPTVAEAEQMAVKLAGGRAGAAEQAKQTVVGANDPAVIRSYAKRLQSGDITESEIPVELGTRNLVKKYIEESNMELPAVLSEHGKTTLASLNPVFKMIDAMKRELEPYKDSNKPASYFLDRAKYAAGVDPGQGGALAAGALLEVVGAARVTQGSSRNFQFIEEAQKHLPDWWKDSPKLMLGKLNNLQENLNATQEGVYKFERKGGVPAGAQGAPANIRDEFNKWKSQQNKK